MSKLAYFNFVVAITQQEDFNAIFLSSLICKLVTLFRFSLLFVEKSQGQQVPINAIRLILFKLKERKSFVEGYFSVHRRCCAM